MSNSLTDTDIEYLRGLRARGFAVTVWTPDEVELLDEDMTAEDLEDAMCEHASNFFNNWPINNEDEN